MEGSHATAKVDNRFATKPLELLLDGQRRIEGEASLPLAHHVNHLNAGERSIGRSKRLEPEHRPGAPLDAAMILLNSVVEILAASDPDPLKCPARIYLQPVLRINGNDCLAVGLAAINDDPLRTAVVGQCLAQKALCCRKVAVFADRN